MVVRITGQVVPFYCTAYKYSLKQRKGHTSHLSKTTCEEFINLTAASMLDHIICEVKNCKYYSVSSDSTPDISTVDQLTLIVCCILPSGPVERFVRLSDVEGHSSEQLTQSLLDFIKENDIDIKDFLGQSYDNTCEDIVKRSSNLIKSYLEDLEESFSEEFVQFTELLKTDPASHIGTK